LDLGSNLRAGPAPTASIAIVAEVPMMMPSAVKPERNL
jgi:hypothetical protein